MVDSGVKTARDTDLLCTKSSGSEYLSQLLLVARLGSQRNTGDVGDACDVSLTVRKIFNSIKWGS